MGASESFNINRNKSFIFKNLNLSIPDIKNKDNKNLSLNFKTAQSDSTTTEDKNEINDIKRSLSKKDVKLQKININNIGNLINEKNMKYSCKKSKISIKDENTQSKKVNLGVKKEDLLKLNKNNQLRKDKYIEDVKNILLKEIPPKINYLHNYNYDLTNNINLKLPNVFINHIISKNSINVDINKNTSYIPLSITKRIKSKNLTILYYRPIKKI